MEKTQLIYLKISEVMSAVKAIGKNRKNTLQNYSFRGIDDMYNALNEHLAKAKIFFTSEVLSKEREERESKSGGTLIYTILTIKWTVYAEDGSFVTTVTVGEAMDSGDKSVNKAMSAAYKYALMQIFCIPTSDSKDTEIETHEVKPKKEFVLSADAPRKECGACHKDFNPTASWQKVCPTCYREKKPVMPKEQPPVNIDEPPFN